MKSQPLPERYTLAPQAREGTAPGAVAVPASSPTPASERVSGLAPMRPGDHKGSGDDSGRWDDIDRLDGVDGFDDVDARPGRQPRLFWAGASAAFVALASIGLLIWQPAPERSMGADDSTSSPTSAMGSGDPGADEPFNLSAVVHEIVDGARKRLAGTRTNDESRPAGGTVDASAGTVDASAVIDAGVEPDRDSSTPTEGDDGLDNARKTLAPSYDGLWDPDL